MIYYKSSNYNSLLTAQDKISANCGFPNQHANKWDDIRQSADKTFWFFQKPHGYDNITQAQMISGVDLANITESTPDSSWYPVEA